MLLRASRHTLMCDMVAGRMPRTVEVCRGARKGLYRSCKALYTYIQTSRDVPVHTHHPPISIMGIGAKVTAMRACRAPARRRVLLDACARRPLPLDLPQGLQAACKCCSLHLRKCSCIDMCLEMCRDICVLLHMCLDICIEMLWSPCLTQ